MKIVSKIFAALTAALLSLPVSAQQPPTDGTALEYGRIEPFEMEVTFDKTSHLIFPSAIRYVDLGGESLIAGKAEKAENVLRLKAAMRDFKEQTNVTVITEDGQYYSFNVYYSAVPCILSYDLTKMERLRGINKSDTVLFEEMGNQPPSLPGQLMAVLYKKNARPVKHISSKSFGITFTLRGLYAYNGKLYFHTEIENAGTIPFITDFISFKIVDRKLAKRTVSQQLTLSPLRMYRPLLPVGAHAAERNIYLLEQLGITDDKVLVIELFEKNGTRSQRLELQAGDLVRAKDVEKMNLKLKL
jgi:conjugative transposon TraN protein